MSVIFLLIPLSLLFATVFLVAFVWAVRSGQYEDTCTPSMRLLVEDPRADGRATGAIPAKQIGDRPDEAEASAQDRLRTNQPHRPLEAPSSGPAEKARKMDWHSP
jgi:cbb3-type cytochrome oxidase maturation protein